MVDKPFSILARVRSFRFAAAGLCHMFRTQHNAWLHLTATTLVVAAGLGLRISAADWRCIVAAMALVWVAEAFNTAFEYLCDVVSPEFRHPVEKAKDIAAGAVLLAALCAVALGVLVFAPYLER